MLPASCVLPASCEVSTHCEEPVEAAGMSRMRKVDGPLAATEGDTASRAGGCSGAATEVVAAETATAVSVADLMKIM